VYLTTAYPFFFGLNAVDEDEEDVLVIETDTDLLFEEKLLPDEDFISQALAHEKKESFTEFHKDVRNQLEGYQHHWEDSLEGLGNCAYKGTIAPDQITRYCIFSAKVRREIAMDLISPSISLMNFKILGDAYQQKVAWMFGDVEEYPMFETMFPAPVIDSKDDGLKEMMEGRKIFWDKQSKDRSGIVVVNVI